MLRSVDEITGYTLAATDGEVGRCWDFLFDDTLWVVRYMIADTRKWLPGRKVLISPILLGTPDWETRRFPVDLTKDAIKAAPPLREDAPVSRQYEAKYFQHYEIPFYWVSDAAWGAYMTPAAARAAARAEQADEGDIGPGGGDPRLRSINEVTDYTVSARDGEVGKVSDFILDDEPWIVRYLVFDTGSWLSGRKVLVAPDWVRRIDWPQQSLSVEMTREQVENSPVFDRAQPINREYEARLYDFYGRPRYWSR
jgi:hypothetical protein